MRRPDRALWHTSTTHGGLTPKVTINAGLRYEFALPPVPVGRSARRQLNIAKASVAPAWLGFNAPQPTYTSLAPRLGLEWAPDEKTSVRAGFGIAYDVLFDNLGTLSFPPQYSVTEDVGVAGYPAFLAPNFLKSGGLPTATGAAIATYPNTPRRYCRPAQATLRPIFPQPGSARTRRTPHLTVQRTFGSGLYRCQTWAIAGTKGIHLPTQDLDQCPAEESPPTMPLGTVNADRYP